MTAPSPSKSSNSHGGARNSASRRNFAVSCSQVANIFAGADHAAQIGLHLNRFITIHWQAAGIKLAAMVEATGRYLDLHTKLLARKAHATAWIYVHENGQHEGGHCHILVHVPPTMTGYVNARQRRWLRTITGKKYTASVIRSKPIGRRSGLATSNPQLYRTNLDKLLCYIVKQADEDAVHKFQLTTTGGPGLIIGKRAGTSENIGRAARRKTPAA